MNSIKNEFPQESLFLLPWDPCLVCAHPFPLGVSWKGQWDRRLQNQSGTALSWCLFNDPPSCLSLFFYAATEWLATRVALKSSKERLQLSDLPARLSAERGAPAAAQPCLAEVRARFPGPCFLQPPHCVQSLYQSCKATTVWERPPCLPLYF